MVSRTSAVNPVRTLRSTIIRILLISGTPAWLRNFIKFLNLCHISILPILGITCLFFHPYCPTDQSRMGAAEEMGHHHAAVFVFPSECWPLLQSVFSETDMLWLALICITKVITTSDRTQVFPHAFSSDWLFLHLLIFPFSVLWHPPARSFSTAHFPSHSE